MTAITDLFRELHLDVRSDEPDRRHSEAGPDVRRARTAQAKAKQSKPAKVQSAESGDTLIARFVEYDRKRLAKANHKGAKPVRPQAVSTECMPTDPPSKFAEEAEQEMAQTYTQSPMFECFNAEISTFQRLNIRLQQMKKRLDRLDSV